MRILTAAFAEQDLHCQRTDVCTVNAGQQEDLVAAGGGGCQWFCGDPMEGLGLALRFRAWHAQSGGCTACGTAAQGGGLAQRSVDARHHRPQRLPVRCTAVLHMWQPVIADGLLRTCKLGLRIAAWVELQASRGQDLLSGVNAGDLGGCWYWRRGWLCLTGFRADRLVMCLACVHPKQLKSVKMVCCKPRP